MTGARELLSRVESLGVKVALSAEGKLRVSPPGVLPEELLMLPDFVVSRGMTK